MDDSMMGTAQKGTIEIPTQQAWYEQPMSLDDVRTCIIANFLTIKRSFVAIGFYLKKADCDKTYLEGGYSSILEFAKNEYGLSQSVASRYMSICSRFSEGGNSPNLQKRYQDFDKSKLQEMLSLTDEQLEQVTPEMRVEDIRAMKPGREKKSYDIPYFEVEGQLDFETSIPEIFPDSMKARSEADAPLPPDSFTIDVSDLLPTLEPEESVAISQQQDEQMISAPLQTDVAGECHYRPGYPCSLTMDQHGNCNIECYSSAQRTEMDYDVRAQYCRAAARKLIEAKYDWMREDYKNRVLLVDESERQLKELLLKGNSSTWYFSDPCDAGVAHVNFFPDYIQFFNGDCGGWVGDCSWFYLCAAIQSMWNEIALKKAMKASSGTDTVEVGEQIGSTETQGPEEQDAEVIDTEFSEVDDPQDKDPTDLEIARQELERANNLLNQCLECKLDETDIDIRRMKVKVAALVSLVHDLDDVENPPPKQGQPELPILRNNDQRAAFVDAYETWPLWIETKETDERYYRYDLSDGTSMVVKVYHAMLFDYSITGLNYEERFSEGYGRNEYYILQQGKFFKDCEANRSALIEKLKEIQKKG